jgi:hypothetical protein
MPFAFLGLAVVAVFAALLLFAASASVGLLIGRHDALVDRDTEPDPERQELDGATGHIPADAIPRRTGMTQARSTQRRA